jgi:hypothetical protein
MHRVFEFRERALADDQKRKTLIEMSQDIRQIGTLTLRNRILLATIARLCLLQNTSAPLYGSAQLRFDRPPFFQ